MSIPVQSDVSSVMETPNVAALISFEDLHAILEQVWASYLHSGDELVPLAAAPAVEQISASVSVSGAFMGHVVFATSASAATQIAAILMDLPPQEVSEDDVADCVGEMANVLGGNLKSLLPGPSVLSLPIVMSSNGGNAMRWPDATVALESELTWHGEPISVTVWAQIDPDL